MVRGGFEIVGERGRRVVELCTEMFVRVCLNVEKLFYCYYLYFGDVDEDVDFYESCVNYVLCV